MTMKKKRKLLKLSDELERAILYGILQGAAEPNVVAPEELSKIGRAIHASVIALAENGSRSPFSHDSVFLMATEALGLPREPTREFLRLLATENVGQDAKVVLQKVRDKQLVVDLLNESAAQLQKGSLDVASLRNLLDNMEAGSGAVVSVAEAVRDGLPAPPHGLQLASLPMLNELVGGIIGMWAIAGEPGVGKSTLALQIALDVGRHTSVLYYDFENGFTVVMDRIRTLYKGDLGRIRAATNRLFFRDGIRSLDRDLAAVGAPGLVVIDSVQSLPTYGDQRRIGLDRWVHRLDQLKKRGFYVLLVSEVGRAQYNQDPYIGAFKETGEIEYKADVGLQVIPTTGDDVEVHVVKNRHRPKKGLACHLTRRHSWWFKELTVNDEQEID